MKAKKDGRNLRSGNRNRKNKNPASKRKTEYRAGERRHKAAFPHNCPTTKSLRRVKGGAVFAPFISTLDTSEGFC